MEVKIKEWKMDLDVKNNGIEFEIRDNDGNFLGDCFLTKKGLIWCAGKTSRAKGIVADWNEFIKWMESDGE